MERPLYTLRYEWLFAARANSGDSPRARGNGTAKALLNPSGPEKGRGNAPTSWSPGVPWGVWEPSETIVKSVPLCVYGVRDVCVCVVCVM